MGWLNFAKFKSVRWLLGAAGVGALAWAVAQNLSNPASNGFPIELDSQVVAPSTSPTLNSTYDISADDIVRWTTYSSSKLTSPFDAEGELTLPPAHTWVAGSVKKPAYTTLQWKVGGSWLTQEPADGAPVTAVKWATSRRISVGTSGTGGGPGPTGNVLFSPNRGDHYRVTPYADKLIMVNYVKHNGGQLECRLAKDGSVCPGWGNDNLTALGLTFEGIEGTPLTHRTGSYSPYVITPVRAMEAINHDTGEFFMGVLTPQGPTVMCTNLKTVTSCGSWLLQPESNEYPHLPRNVTLLNMAQVGDKYYMLYRNSKLWCFDVRSRSVCGATHYPNLFHHSYTTPRVLGSKMYIFRKAFGTTPHDVRCHDTVTNAPCANWTGWNPPVRYTLQYLFPYLNTDGSPRGVCVSGAPYWSHTCVGEDGQPFNASANYSEFMLKYGLITSSTPVHDLGAFIGTKVYGARNWTGGNGDPLVPASAGCYDFATDSLCGTWPSRTNGVYSTRIDPTRANCLIISGAGAGGWLGTSDLEMFDVTTGKACQGGTTGGNPPEITADPRADAFQCNSARARVDGWGQLRLSPSVAWGGGGGLTRITATFKDGNGNLLPSNLKPVRQFAQGSYTLDISTDVVVGRDTYPKIKYSDYPVLKVSLAFESVTPLPSSTTFGVDLTYDGDPTQVCVSTKVPASPDCQTGASVTVKHQAIDRTGPDSYEQASADKIMSPASNWSSNGYAAFPAATTPRFTAQRLSARDPQTQIVQGRWAWQHFSGDLWAFNLNQSGQLIGSPFQSAQSSTLVPSQRKIFTAQPTDNVQTKAVTDLNWANLADVQREALNLDHKGVRDNQGVARLSYLRGTDAGAFRGRNGFTLGPVINSAPVILPTWAAESRPEAHFPGFSDYRKTLPRAFPLAIYGGNDGALHAYETKGESLSEAWTFVPDVMLRRASNYSDLNPAEIRSKPYFVDNVPIVGHTNIRSESNPDWRAVAVILYGRGARAITALDISQTDLKQGSGVLFEYTNTSAPDLKDLGYIISQPDTGAGFSSAQLVKLADKRSAVLVGNGIESNDGKSGTPAASGTGTPVLYAFYLDKADAATKYRAWSIGDKNVWSGIETEPEVAFDNGLSTPTPVDVDHNGTIDVVYAGDLKGNLWRFDVSTPSAVKATRLFKTDENQPITQAPFVSVNTLAKNCGADNAPANAKRCWQVVFSTGAAISPLIGSPNVSTQSIYGILDKGKGRAVALGNLTTINYETNRVINGVEYRALKPTTVNYDNDAVLGWRANLQAFEHGVGAPRLQPTGLVMFSSVRPTTPNQATNICIGPRSWLNEVDPLHGYSPIVAFDTNGDGKIDGQDRFDADSDKPISPTSMAVSGAQFGPPTILRSASTQSQQMSLLLPSLGQDTGQANSWSGGSGADGSSSPAPDNSAALTHSNKAKLGRMTWREVY